MIVGAKKEIGGQLRPKLLGSSLEACGFESYPGSHTTGCNEYSHGGSFVQITPRLGSARSHLTGATIHEYPDGDDP